MLVLWFKFLSPCLNSKTNLDNVRASKAWEACEPRLRVNMRIAQLLKANHFKMGALQCRPEISVPKNACETSTRKLRTRVYVYNTRIKNVPSSKIISMYELAHCLSIVYVLLLVSAQHSGCVNSEEFDKIATRVSKWNVLASAACLISDIWKLLSLLAALKNNVMRE